MAGMDIMTCSSAYGEAFPVAIGEAMACGVPCVVTDVGDSALLVGDTGQVVAAGAPGELSEAWRHVLEMDPTQRKRLGQEARKRVEEHFSLPVIVNRYESVYTSLCKGSRGINRHHTGLPRRH